MQASLKGLRKQAGLTLIELISAIAVAGLVIAGALAMYNSATSGQTSNQMNVDLNGIRSATKGLYAGSGGYGTGSLNSVLINANRVPSTMTISGTTITHSLNGTVTVTGATSNYTITLTNIPTNVCTAVVSAAQGYSSVQVGANAARTTFPIGPANAAADCAAAATQSIVFTAS